MARKINAGLSFSQHPSLARCEYTSIAGVRSLIDARDRESSASVISESARSLIRPRIFRADLDEKALKERQRKGEGGREEKKGERTGGGSMAIHLSDLPDECEENFARRSR